MGTNKHTTNTYTEKDDIHGGNLMESGKNLDDDCRPKQSGTAMKAGQRVIVAVVIGYVLLWVVMWLIEHPIWAVLWLALSYIAYTLLSHESSADHREAGKKTVPASNLDGGTNKLQAATTTQRQQPVKKKKKKRQQQVNEDHIPTTTDQVLEATTLRQQPKTSGMSKAMDNHGDEHGDSGDFQNGTLTSNNTSHHWSHPEHALAEVDDKTPCTCNVCKMEGRGKRHRCNQCDSCDVHPTCITIQGHKCKLRKNWAREPCKKTGCNNKCSIYCNACGMKIEDSHYHCPMNSLNFHPTCAKLCAKFENEVTFYECKFSLQTQKEAVTSKKCVLCGSKRPKGARDEKNLGWSFLFGENKEYNIHVQCMGKLAKDLQDVSSSNRRMNHNSPSTSQENKLQKSKKRSKTIRWLKKILTIFLRTALSILLGFVVDPTFFHFLIFQLGG